MKSFAKFQFVARLVFFMWQKNGQVGVVAGLPVGKNPGWCFAYFFFSGGIRPYFR
jgi:hypothetical protein